MNAAEKRHVGRVVQLGCIVCKLHLGVYSPAVAHHLKNQTGIGRKSGHDQVIPLCFRHHDAGVYGESFHAGRGIWELRFGSQVELLERVRELLA